MAFYCYRVSVDGRAQPTVGSNSASAEEAIAHGRAMLLATVASVRPLQADCVVADPDSPPLGLWNWSIEADQAVWSPAH